jgi:hypothetical protein
MAGLRSVHIVDEAHFLELVGQLPDPITPETRKEYNRLRAIATRRGFAWPYRTYVDPARRRMPMAKNVRGYY